MRAQFWQGLGEGQHAPVLVLVAQFAPLRVVAVLLAATGIATGCLQMPLRVGADPHICVGRRNHQRGYARKGGAVAHPLAIGIQVNEAVAPASPGQARLAVVNVVQAARQGAVEHGGQASIRSLINGQHPRAGCSAQ
ncbi:hypothetical protein D3C80_1551040 [compost metagenome]